MRKIEKHLIILTLAILFTLTIVEAASAADGDTNLVVTSPVSGAQGGTVTLSATLTRDRYNGGWEKYNGQRVYFYVDGQLVGSDNTNAQGVASVNYHIPVDSTPGSHTIAAVFNGNSPYDPATGYGTLTVTSSNHNPVASPDSVTTNQNTPVSIAASSLVTNDVDPDGDTLTVTSVGSAGHGTVTLSAGSVTYTPSTGYHGSDSFTYTVSDGKGGTATGTVNIRVNGIPVANPDSASTYENTAKKIDVVSNDNDPDGDSFSVTGVTQGSQGSVINNHDGTVTYTPANGFVGTDTFTYTITDANGATNTATVTVTVANRAPVAGDNTATVDKNSYLYITTSSLLANDNDPDGDLLTVIGVGNAIHGNVVLNGETITFTPTLGYSGTGSFTYTVSDGKGGTDTATVTINIVNHAPVAVTDATTTNQNIPVTITNLLANDADPDGDSLIIAGVGSAGHGIVTLNLDGTVTYTPTTGYIGSDSFTYTVSDADGGTAMGAVDIRVNGVPVANPDSVTTNQNTPVTIPNLLANDVDPDGDSLIVTGVGSAGHGTVTLNLDGTVTYTPDTDYHGTDSFTYTVSDNKGGIATGIVNVRVNLVPVAVADINSVSEDGSIVGASVAGNDNPGDTPSTWHLVTGPTNGQLVFNPNGSYTYTPNPDYNGLDSFTYYISDADENSATVTVYITVTPVNDAPIATGDSQSTNENTPVSGSVTGTDVDTGDILTYTLGTDDDAPKHGTVSLNFVTGAYTYTPEANYHGTDIFKVIVSDGHGGFDTATVTITVNPVNDAPVADDGSQTIDEDHTATGQVTAGDVDGDSLTYVKDTDPVHGTVTVNADGSYTYTPNSNWFGTDSFKVTVSDGHGGSDTATVTITVNSVNDAPIADDDSKTIPEDTSISGQVTAGDVDGDSLTYALGTGLNHGTVIVNADGSWTYTPFANYHGTDSFTVTVSDDHGGFATATVVITVNSVNDAPIADDDSKTIDEDHTATGQVTGSDVDGDSLTYVKDTDPVHGTVTVNADGSYTYTPNSNWFGTDSFKVTVSDGHGGFATATVIITVNSVNDVPVANDDSKTIDEDHTVTGQVTGSDVDGDSLTYAKDTDPVHGTVTVNADGSYTYTPFANYNGSDSFTVLVSDGKGGLATATVTITVTPVNDADVFVKTSISKTKLFIGENTVVTVKVGNNGPDSAQNVVVTYKIPEGMTFVGLTYEAGYPAPVYDPATNTVTWNLGDLGIIDPWMKVVLYADETGTITNSANVISDTSDLVESNNLASIIVEIQNLVPEQPSIPEANAVSKTRTIPLQHTGLPLAGFVLAALAIAGGLIPKRKN